MRLSQLVSETQHDHDLLLDIKARNGKQCTVSQANKYCAYAEHKKAVAKGNVGYEIIDIYNLTESNYLLYEKVGNENYAGDSCPEYQNAAKHYASMHDASKFWDRVGGEHKVARLIKKFWSIFCFNGWGWPSVKHTNTHQDERPTIDNDCLKLYPTSSAYTLDKLNTANANALNAEAQARSAAENARLAQQRARAQQTWWNPFD